MSELPESSDSGISRRADYAIAKRSTTLVARGLADLQRGLQSAETLMLIESGDIYEAIKQEDLDAVRRILDLDATKVHARLREEDAERYTDKTLKSWDSPFQRSFTPLHVAAASGMGQMAQAIIAKGGDVNARTDKSNDDRTPLHLAVTGELGCPADVVTVLLAAGADIDAVDLVDDLGATPLRLACMQPADLGVVELLVAAGANPRETDLEGGNLLSECGSVDVAAFLVNLGVSPFTVDQELATPLHRVSKRADVKLVKFLLSVGADPNAQDAWGRSPLHRAMDDDLELRFIKLYRLMPPHFRLDRIARQVETAQHLLGHRADPNLGMSQSFGKTDKHAHSQRGDTPLHLAAWTGELALVRVLVDNGADPKLSNDFGVTPLQIAATEGHSEIVRELQASGAKESDARTQPFD